MRAARNFALILGIGYTLIALIGFLGLKTPVPADAPGVAVDAGHGYLLGLFPVNLVHDIIHLLVGLGGLGVYFANASPFGYNRVIGIVFALLAIMGFFPVLNTTFGLVPLYSNDIWLHGLTSLLGLYFGFAVARQPAAMTRA